MTVRRLVGWVTGGALVAVVAWSVLQPTSVAKAGLDRLMLDLVTASRPAPALYSIEGDGPPLGEPHEWYVVASDGHELARIDLADGDIDGYMLEGYPQIGVGGGGAGAELVLAGPAPQPVYAVSLHDPAGSRHQLFRWPIDAGDPVNGAYYAVERVDDGTIRVNHVRQEGIELVPAVVDIDLATGRRQPAPSRIHTGDSNRWLARWIGNPTASVDDGEITAGPASQIGRRAVLVRRRGGDSFHNPISIPLRFRPEKVMLVPKPSVSASSPKPAAVPPPLPSTTTSTVTSPIAGLAGNETSTGLMAADGPVPAPPVPAGVLEELNRLGLDYLIAGNHRSFHRVDLATGDVDRFDLGLRVVGVVPSITDVESGDDGAAGAELIAIRPGSAVVALAADEPAGPARQLLSLRSEGDGPNGSMTVRVVAGRGGVGADLEYWDRSATPPSWRRLDLDFDAGRPVVGRYRMTPAGRGVMVTDEGDQRRYMLPIPIAGGVSTVLLV